MGIPTVLEHYHDMTLFTLIFSVLSNLAIAGTPAPLNAAQNGRSVAESLTNQLNPRLSVERLSQLGALYEPDDSPVWEYAFYDSPLLKKVGATTNYQTPTEITWPIFHLAVHVSGDPSEDRVAAGIETLATVLKEKGIPSVLLDRYPNILNRHSFDLEVNDYMSGGGYHSMTVRHPTPKLIISGAYLDGCVSNALSHFLAQMEKLNQLEMDIYVVRDLTVPFCEIGYEESQRVQDPIEDLNQCMSYPMIENYGPKDFLSLMIDSFQLDIDRLRQGRVSEMLIPAPLRPSQNNDIGFEFSFDGKKYLHSDGARKVRVHFLNKAELFQTLGI